MKKIVLLLFMTFPVFTLIARNKNPVKKFYMKPGVYRQLFYADGARQVTDGAYILETSIDSLGIVVKIIGTRQGDDFDVIVMLNDSTRKLIMEQAFFMTGVRNDQQSYDTWFVSWKRKELNQFIEDYFGIKILKRKEFIRYYRQKMLREASEQEVSFIGQNR